MLVRAQDPVRSTDPEEYTVAHAECSYFGVDHDKFASTGLNRPPLATRRSRTLSGMTEAVSRFVAGPPPGSPTYSFGQTHAAGSIDSYIQADWKTNGIVPAPMTTDWEFIRRATLDLTGRIPDPSRVLTFVADTSANKRAALIDELLAKPEWVDKWTMYFGDLYGNTVTKPSTGLNRFAQGRNAFYQWIHDSMASEKPYNVMATELIAVEGPDNFQTGAMNYLVGGVVSTLR